MRLGIMGGTFDPIHFGHLVAAQEVLWALGLEKMLFVPAGEPPHKISDGSSSVSHRVQMVKLAIACNPGFELSMVDASRPGKSYTVDTLRILREQLGSGVELFFVLGMDSLAELINWKDPAGIIAQCRLAVVNRPPYPELELTALERELPGIADRLDVVFMPGIGTSASELRRRVAAGQPIRYQLPEAVEAYIGNHGLYQSVKA